MTSSSNWVIPSEMLGVDTSEKWDYAPEPFNNESFLSWFSRLAKDNCSDVDLLYQKLKNPYYTKRLSEPLLESHLRTLETDETIRNDLIEILSSYISFPAIQIKKLSFNILKKPAKWDYLNILLETPRFCPKCLAEDEIPYFRSYWFLKFVTYCEKHKILLKDVCPHCFSPIFFWKTPWNQTIESCYYCQEDLRQDLIRYSKVKADFQKILLNIFKSGFLDKNTNSITYFQQLWKIVIAESKDRTIKKIKSNLIKISPERVFKVIFLAQKCIKKDIERLSKPFVCKIDGLFFTSEIELEAHIKQKHILNLREINSSELTQYQIDENIKNRKIIEAIRNGQYYKQIIFDYEISYGKYQKLKAIYNSYLNKEISEIKFNQKLIPQKPVGRKKLKLFDVDENDKISFIDTSFEKAIKQGLENRGYLEVSEVWKTYRKIKQHEAFSKGFTSKKNETQRQLIKIAKSTSSFDHVSRHIFYDEFIRYHQISSI